MPKKLAAILSTALILQLSPSISKAENKESKNPTTKKSSAKKSDTIYKDVSPEEAYKLWKAKKVIPIDVRPTKAYSSARIKGAHHYDLLDKEFTKKISKLDKNKPYLLYCGNGKRSAKAFKILKKLGFKKLYNMSGGLQKWKEKKLPLEKKK